MSYNPTTENVPTTVPESEIVEKAETEQVEKTENDKEVVTTGSGKQTPQSTKGKSPSPTRESIKSTSSPTQNLNKDSPSPTRQSRKGSKPGTAKSSAKKQNLDSGKRSRTPKSANKDKSAKKKDRANSKFDVTDGNVEENPDDTLKGKVLTELPDGCESIFLSGDTQKIFHCVTDDDVTEENPYKFIKKEDITTDLYNRAAVSDFHPIKEKINSYEGEEFLLGYDRDYKFSQNFFIALTEEAKDFILSLNKEEGEETVEEEVPTYVPPVSKLWKSHGSEIEITDGFCIPNRKPLKLSIDRVRKTFGNPTSFSDRVDKENRPTFDYVECLPFEDKSFEIKRLEVEQDIQAVPEVTEKSSQTAWPYPKNSAIQYEARQMDEKAQTEICESKEMEEIVNNSLSRFHIALQQNEIANFFYDDWAELPGDDSALGSKADNHLKEYQSFTDLQFSKNKCITHIEWHPSIRGVIAVSIGERRSFDDRIDHSGKIIMSPSLILIWSFHDPIHPQIVLEAPDDIQVFSFNPTNPDYIAGGCCNGQVVLWDISKFSYRLKTQRFEENDPDHVKIRYNAVSNIDNSHKGPITDLLWVPDHIDINGRTGVPLENKEGKCVQIMTCSVDHWSLPILPNSIMNSKITSITPPIQIQRNRSSLKEKKTSDKENQDIDVDQYVDDYVGTGGVVLFWDTRAPKTLQQQNLEAKWKAEPNPMNIPFTFRHLDLTWKPILKVTLPKSEPGGDHSPTKFSISEKQGDRRIIDELNEAQKEKERTAGLTGIPTNKPSSATKRALTMMNTHFYVGTEDGELVYVDWMPQKDQDTGKMQTSKADFYHSLHAGPIVTLKRNPFFKDLILCVGGWNFSIWKEGVKSGPIIFSSSGKRRLLVANWSPTRPSVFFVGRSDGSIDVWDLLDKTHEPSLTQNISTAGITDIYPHRVTQKQQFLAVSDLAGTLHILEIPKSLQTPADKEINSFQSYIDREVKRRAFVVERWDLREMEKRQLEAEAKLKAGIAPQHILTDEETAYRLKQEYAAYLDEEHNFLRELGLIKDEEEELPIVD